MTHHTHDWIDSHFHLYPDSLDTANAGDALQQVCRATGIDTLSIACVLHLLPGWDSRQLFLAFLLKSLRPEQTYVFGALDYSEEGACEGKADFAAQARRQFEMGVDGFKMLEGKPTSRRILKIPMDAPAYDPFYDFLERHSLPLLAHVADPAICWDAERIPAHFRNAGYFYADGSFPSFEGFRTEALNVARKHPGLKLTLAHFFFASADVEQAAQIMERHPNVAFDLTPGFEMYDDFAAKPDEWRDFFVRYDTRILFGTDNHLPGRVEEPSLRLCRDKVNFIRSFLENNGEVCADICGFKYRTRGLHLLPATVALIGGENFRRRLASRTPRAMDRPLVLAECRLKIERLEKARSGVSGGSIESAGLKAMAALL
jgi:hypothetical protein